MKTEQMIVIGMGLAIVALATYWEASGGWPLRIRHEITPQSLLIGMNRPIIWLFYNDSEINKSNDGTNVLNIPLLNMLYKNILSKNGDIYRVEVIYGLVGVAELMGGWSAMPKSMQAPKSRISCAEEEWIRTAILAKNGGLWLSPSVLCLQGFGKLPQDKIVAYGQDESPMYASPIPGFRALWSPKAGHEVFVEWEGLLRNRLENGKTHGDYKSDWLNIMNENEDSIELYIDEELGRNPKTSKKIELEDILAAGTGGVLPFDVPSCAVYLVIPYQDLLNRRHFGWILKANEHHIMESDIALKYLF